MMLARDVIALALDWTALMAVLLGVVCGALAVLPFALLLGRRGR